MVKFTFRLERLLELRRRIERDRQLDTAHVERERRGLEGDLKRAGERFAALRQDLREMLTPADSATGASVRMRDARLQATATHHVVMNAQRRAVELAGVMRRLEQSRAALAQATARRRAVETLREKQFEAWRRAHAKREQLELDDISSSRAARADAAPGASL